MNRCSRCSKPIQNGATVTIEKPVYNSSVELFYTLCGYCTEDLEEFVSRKEPTPSADEISSE